MLNRSILRALALVGAVALAWYAADRGGKRGNDFKYPYRAAELLRETGGLRVDAQPRYPITLHVLLAPLTRLPIGQAAAVFAVLSIAAVATLPLAISRLSGVTPRRQILAWCLVGPFFVDAIGMGQGDPINIALVAWGLVAAKKDRGFAGAILIGLAGLIKILPLAQWATLLARRRSPGVLVGIGATAVVAVGLVALAVGWLGAIDGFRDQAAWLRDNEKPWHLVARGGDLRANNESLPIVLARTFCALPDPSRAPGSVSLARLPLGFAWTAWAILLGVLAVSWLATIGPASRLDPGRGWLGMFALTSIGMLASTPICWHHYFLWLLPAAAFLAHRRRLLASLSLLSIAITAIPAARGLGGHMAMALGLFAIVARAIQREPRGAGQTHVRLTPSASPPS